jgi:hypothetical protein
MYREPVTEQSAAKIAREWINDRSDIPRDHHAQARWLMDQLAQLCIAESLRQNEDEDQLCNRVSDAADILSSTWYLAAPPFATKWWGDNEKPSSETQKEIEAAKRVIWVRHDPQRSFQSGWDSKHYISLDKSSLNSTIADYLGRPWLRHAALDWIFLDMTITGELCALGEFLKERCLPGPKDKLFGTHQQYAKAKGNLTKMRKVDWNSTLERMNNWFWLAIGFPIAIIWGAFHFGFQSSGFWLSGIYAAIWIVVSILKLLKFVRRLITRLSGQIEPTLRPFQLWDEMYKVWRLLEGPVVNPTMVREAMHKSADQGAVWDTISWSLIDRVISLDPAIWIVAYRY